MAAPAAPAAPGPGKRPARTGVAAEAVLGKAYDLRLIRRLERYARPHVHLLVGWVVLTVIRTGFELAQPWLLAYVLQHHILGGDVAALKWDALGYVGLVIGQNATMFCEQLLVQLAGQRTMHDLRIAIFDHVLAQRAAFFDRIPVGRLMTRMTNDIESLNEMFSQGAITIIGDAIKATGIIVVMLVIDVPLSLMTFITLPLLFVIVEYARRAMRTSFRQIRVRLAAMNAFAQEHLFGIRVVQLLGRGRIAQREYDEINAGHRDAYLLQIRADAAMYALVEAIGYIAIGGVLWWASGASVEGAATIAVVVAFTDYIARFFEPIRDLSAKYAVMQGAMAACERIFELLDTDEFDGSGGAAETLALDPAGKKPPRASAPSGAVAPGSPRDQLPAIELAGVEFSYGAEPVLRGVDLRVPRGATVALVGATGSGKSTVIKLLTRLYERDSGAIRIDGVDVRDIPLGELRRRITVVSQDVILFAGTLADNIALGKPYSVAELEAAIRQVGLDRRAPITGDGAPDGSTGRAGDPHGIDRRAPAMGGGAPESAGPVRRDVGLATRVAERGANFSAGERQLVAFARALLRDPEILVLDEATAHVDPEAEELIERGVAALMTGRTTLVIAHRLSTIRNADLIVVMDKGQILEQGRHDELVARGGLYAALERTFSRHGRE